MQALADLAKVGLHSLLTSWITHRRLALSLCSYIYTCGHSNRALCRYHCSLGNKVGKCISKEENPPLLSCVTKPRRHLLPPQFLLATTNIEGSTKFTTHFRKYFLILFSLVMLHNSKAWAVISHFQFHRNQFILSLTHRCTLSYLPSAQNILEDVEFLNTTVLTFVGSF